MNARENGVMVALRTFGEPMTLYGLARELERDSDGVLRDVRALIRAGLVKRHHESLGVLRYSPARALRGRQGREGSESLILNSPHYVRILQVMEKRGEPMTLTEVHLATVCQVQPQGLAYHLNQLAAAGYITKAGKRSRERLWALVDATQGETP